MNWVIISLEFGYFPENHVKPMEKKDKKKVIDTTKCLGFLGEPVVKTISTRDALLYAYSLGYSQDPMREKDLLFTYENTDGFSVNPVMLCTAIGSASIFTTIVGAPGVPQFNPMMLLHGEQKTIMYRPFEADTTITTTPKLAEVVDKGKGTLVSLEGDTYSLNGGTKGDLICKNISSFYIRGLNAEGPKGDPVTSAIPKPPARPPCKEIIETTLPGQAVIYRLNGDMNPLHIDPGMAGLGGFERPILHGLCTYGITGKVIIEHFMDNDVKRMKSIHCRFTSHVFPGETLVFKAWKEGNIVIVSGSTKERGKEVIVGVVELLAEPAPKL